MTHHLGQEERLILNLVERLPLAEDEKNAWLERIRNGEMSNELADEIRQKLAEHTEGDEKADVRARYMSELTNLVRRWGLNSQSKNFSRR